MSNNVKICKKIWKKIAKNREKSIEINNKNVIIISERNA